MFSLLACQQRQTELYNGVLPVPDTGRVATLLIPLDGCGTCIANSAQYVNDHLQQLPRLRVYVYSMYEKRYKQFDSTVIAHPNFIIDRNQQVFSAFKVDQKPRVVFMDHGEVLEDYYYDNGDDQHVFHKIEVF